MNIATRKVVVTTLVGMFLFSGITVGHVYAAVDLTGKITKVKVKEKQAGLKLVVKLEVCNAGNETVTGPVMVSLFGSSDQNISDNDDLLQSFMIEKDINSGQCALNDKGKLHKFKVKKLADLEGTFAIVVIDFDEVITESDEENNIFTSQISFLLPDVEGGSESPINNAEDAFIYQADNPRAQGFGSVLRINKSLGQVDASVALPPGSFALAGIAVGPNYVWVTSPGNDKLHRVEKSSFSSVETFDLEPNSKPWGIAVGETKVWVTHQAANKIISYSRTTGSVVNIFDYQTSLVSGRRPWGIAVDNSWVWVANNGDISGPESDTVIKLFRSNGGFEKEINVDPHMASLSPRSSLLGILSDGLNVWIVSNELTPGSAVSSSGIGGSLIQYNIVNTDSIGPFFPDRTLLGQAPQYLALNDTHVWVTHLAESFVTKVFKFTNAVIGSSSLPVGPVGRGVSISDDKVWIASAGQDANNTSGMLQLDTAAITEPAGLLEGGELGLSFGDMTGQVYNMFFSN